jgi:aspartyl-tRNA(Asn)/glutamyl-tRNA(Gln) amidotransferase subunit B
MFHSGKSADELIQKRGLEQKSDRDELMVICQKVIADHPKPVEEYRNGKENAIHALKGPVMKETKGRANPQIIDQILKELLA